MSYKIIYYKLDNTKREEIWEEIQELSVSLKDLTSIVQNPVMLNTDDFDNFYSGVNSLTERLQGIKHRVNDAKYVAFVEEEAE